MESNYHQFESIHDIKRFLFAGNSTITLESVKTGVWFTYKINENKKGKDVRFFVKVLTGNDNTKSFTYMGTIYGGKVFKLNDSSRISAEAQSYKAFQLFFTNLMYYQFVNVNMKVYHSGVCGRCGRKLTVPESINEGLGPECRGLVPVSIADIRKKKLQKIEKQLLYENNK